MPSSEETAPNHGCLIIRQRRRTAYYTPRPLSLRKGKESSLVKRRPPRAYGVCRERWQRGGTPQATRAIRARVQALTSSRARAGEEPIKSRHDVEWWTSRPRRALWAKTVWANERTGKKPPRPTWSGGQKRCGPEKSRHGRRGVVGKNGVGERKDRCKAAMTAKSKPRCRMIAS